jgi:hypothetical protein
MFMISPFLPLLVSKKKRRLLSIGLGITVIIKAQLNRIIRGSNIKTLPQRRIPSF